MISAADDQLRFLASFIDISVKHNSVISFKFGKYLIIDMWKGMIPRNDFPTLAWHDTLYSMILTFHFHFNLRRHQLPYTCIQEENLSRISLSISSSGTGLGFGKSSSGRGCNMSAFSSSSSLSSIALNASFFKIKSCQRSWSGRSILKSCITDIEGRPSLFSRALVRLRHRGLRTFAWSHAAMFWNQGFSI